MQVAVVDDTAKVLIFEQITTKTCGKEVRYEVVDDTAKVLIFEQITTVVNELRFIRRC